MLASPYGRARLIPVDKHIIEYQHNTKVQEIRQYLLLFLHISFDCFRSVCYNDKLKYYGAVRPCWRILL